MPADTAAVNDAAELSFSSRIREASWSRHQGLDPSEGSSADRVPGVFDRLFDGTLSLADYTRWHAQQYFVYEAIESAAQLWRDHPVAGAFVFDELARREAIEADLVHLMGPKWRSGIEPLPATRAYVERINATAREWPGGYIAHSYTRYLGDLSGGQAFGRAARRNYDFDGAGASFYEFQGIASPKAFKDEYRSRLDAAGLGERDQARVIEEVLLAYDHNGAVLAALGAGLDANPFEPKEIAAICHHMNVDHAEDTLVICQGAGGRPEATSARMTGFDGTGADFAATVDGTEEPIRIAWAAPLSARAEVRPEIVRIFTESKTSLAAR